jgi:hypothetical protein
MQYFYLPKADMLLLRNHFDASASIEACLCVLNPWYRVKYTTCQLSAVCAVTMTFIDIANKLVVFNELALAGKQHTEHIS